MVAWPGWKKDFLVTKYSAKNNEVKTMIEKSENKSALKVGDRVVTTGAEKAEGTVISTERKGDTPVVVMLDDGILLTCDILGSTAQWGLFSRYGSIKKAPKIEKVTLWVMWTAKFITSRVTEEDALLYYKLEREAGIAISKPAQMTFDVEVTN